MIQNMLRKRAFHIQINIFLSVYIDFHQILQAIFNELNMHKVGT